MCFIKFKLLVEGFTEGLELGEAEGVVVGSAVVGAKEGAT